MLLLSKKHAVDTVFHPAIYSIPGRFFHNLVTVNKQSCVSISKTICVFGRKHLNSGSIIAWIGYLGSINKILRLIKDTFGITVPAINPHLTRFILHKYYEIFLVRFRSH